MKQVGVMYIPWVGKVKRPLPWLLGLGLAGVIIAGGGIWVSHSSRKLDLAAYTVAVQRGDNLTLRITASGKVVPIQTVNISPKNSGQLAQLYVEQGDLVKKGEIIARMDPRDAQAQLDLAQAQLADAIARRDRTQAGNRRQEIAQAQNQVTAAQARMKLAQERLKRNQTLAAEGAISRDSLDALIADNDATAASLQEARKRLDLLREGARVEDIRQANAQVAASKAQVEAAKVVLADTVIRAPFSGIITQKYATPGAFVTPTTSASTTTSATSTSIVAIAEGLEVIAQVPEVDIGQIKLGMPVDIVADAFPDQTFSGDVRLVAPEAVVEQNVTFFQVRVKIRTGLDKLRSGMNVDLVFIGQSLPNALLIPTVAIATEKGKTGVYVPGPDQKPVFRPITTGSSIEDQTQVLEGLQAEDVIFVDFPAQLRPKQNN
ncbi:efflux RND transporter periplasmic adaptor subunit [Thermosynechococcaceae cyanobacterium BACA0444]|uniref:Efflux RND transporter periplasmic adaptor subunit n=2 Tax=Pseudocalidococcus TaxID=3110321 RepID=A0AAE4FWP8_9CYAN|nr:efflux RND transporter periplasmic adaptor subunit [Pseudocalidococcus azoricus]MDS3862360.1 efflux RND transporter periplasmic adaptor subunit [Pseudocalidococcus azoricus BACA0444]